MKLKKSKPVQFTEDRAWMETTSGRKYQGREEGRVKIGPRRAREITRTSMQTKVTLGY